MRSCTSAQLGHSKKSSVALGISPPKWINADSWGEVWMLATGSSSRKAVTIRLGRLQASETEDKDWRMMTHCCAQNVCCLLHGICARIVCCTEERAVNGERSDRFGSDRSEIVEGEEIRAMRTGSTTRNQDNHHQVQCRRFTAEAISDRHDRREVVVAPLYDL
jgi:hypothetical protein